MTLLLTNEEIESFLTMPECISALEEAYRERAAGRTVNRPRSDIYTAHELPDAHYVFKSFEGMLPSAGVVALRLNSDVIAWSNYAGNVRKDKRPLAGGRWVGLVLLFSTSTGEPLAIFPDGVVQRMRVGATNGLAARYLARKDARVYGLLGAGWQAGAQLMAMAAVRDLEEVRVYSPRPESRHAFAEEYSEKLGLPVRAVDSPEEAASGVDILGSATNTISPVIRPEWLKPGLFVTCVKRSEMGEEALARCHRVVVHSREGAPYNYIVGLGDSPLHSHDPVRLLARLRSGEQVRPEDVQQEAGSIGSLGNEPELSELVGGKVAGRADDTETTAFVNNVGLGIQFAAVGALVYRRARELGLGRELPTEWFTQTVHP